MVLLGYVLWNGLVFHFIDLFSTVVLLGYVLWNGLVFHFIDLFSTVVLLGYVLWNVLVFHFILYFHYGLARVCTLERSSVSFHFIFPLWSCFHTFWGHTLCFSSVFHFIVFIFHCGLARGHNCISIQCFISLYLFSTVVLLGVILSVSFHCIYFPLRSCLVFQFSVLFHCVCFHSHLAGLHQSAIQRDQATHPGLRPGEPDGGHPGAADQEHAQCRPDEPAGCHEGSVRRAR